MKFNKRIIGSILTIGIVGAIGVAATTAYFSDSETSVGNTFVAGDIDLQIDNESYAIDWNIPGYQDPIGAFVASTHTSWELTDLTIEKFFDFVDLKPGDYGEDTISVHVGSNDAWLCAAAKITADHDNTYVDPELEDDNTVNEADPQNTDGELDEEVNFAFWVDDGDNVYEVGENVFLQGPLSGLGEAGQIALADTSGQAVLQSNPVAGGEIFYIGKYWCFGDMESTNVPQDNATNNGPLGVRGTGFTCDGASVDNAAQTDVVVGDLEFYAEQSRNNESFLCSQWNPTFEGQRPLVGAALSSYEGPPDVCDQILSSSESIQTAINSASAGDTICLEDGTYNNDTYPLRVNKDGLTIAGLNPPTSTAELPGGVVLDNDGTSLTGVFISGQTSLFGETWGVYINTGVDGAEISYNVITGVDTSPSRGIINATGTTTNAYIAHNEISHWTTGIFMNPSSGMVMEYNTLFDNVVGSGNDGPSGNSIMYSVIRDNSAEGVGVSDSTVGNAGSLSVNFNNIFGNPSDDQMNNYDLDADDNGFTVDAENNWWGDNSPGDNINGAPADSAPIDFDPWESSAFPEN